MSDLNDPLKESYIGKVADALSAYVDDLKAAGFDPTSRIAQLTAAGGLIETASKARKAAEQVVTDSIVHEQGLRDQSYKLAVETVSLEEGLLGKAHPLTVKLRGLRADLIGSQNTGGTPPPPATTPAK